MNEKLENIIEMINSGRYVEAITLSPTEKSESFFKTLILRTKRGISINYRLGSKECVEILKEIKIRQLDYRVNLASLIE